MPFSSLGRRTLTLTRFHRSISSSVVTHSMTRTPSTTFVPLNPNGRNPLKTQISWFRWSQISCYSSRGSSSSYKDDEQISPDTILFEGCDYNHWLITMDFRDNDPKPTPEEMVETYVQTLAKVVGSVEEAKKRMYACSTTTYTGFQAVMTEEMSEKFRDLPGVVFILPDSYIDPVNKEYGGDKYINGTIIPRPPPVQYSRQGRYGDRNRNREGPPQGDGRNYGGPRQNYGPPQNFGPSPSAPRDGRNYGGPQQNYGPPQQNYGPPQQNYGPPQSLPASGDGNKVPQQNYGPPQNFGPSPPAPGDGRNYGVAQQNYGPPQNFGPGASGDGRNYGEQQNYPPQRNLGSYPSRQGDGSSVGAHQNYGPNPSGQIPVGNRDYVPERRDNYQNERSSTLPSYQGDFPQAGSRDYPRPENRDFRGNTGNIYPPTGDFSQGAGSSYGQSYPVHGEGQRVPPGDGRQ